MAGTRIESGYVYHIKDSYFSVAQDDKLMRNHEGGALRPTYFCLRDEKTRLFWMIPMSSRVDKYQAIIDRETARYGRCLKVLVERYGNGESAFLFQNMFPILPKYINHAHTIGGVPMAVNPVVQEAIIQQFKEIRRMHARGIPTIFPDINRLERLMLDELAADEAQK